MNLPLVRYSPPTELQCFTFISVDIVHVHVGLDSTGSLDLLTHLNKLAGSHRTVILTIHQPRLEIFHMFDHLVLLTEGKVRM